MCVRERGCGLSEGLVSLCVEERGCGLSEGFVRVCVLGREDVVCVKVGSVCVLR